MTIYKAPGGRGGGVARRSSARVVAIMLLICVYMYIYIYIYIHTYILI